MGKTISATVVDDLQDGAGIARDGDVSGFGVRRQTGGAVHYVLRYRVSF